MVLYHKKFDIQIFRKKFLLFYNQTYKDTRSSIKKCMHTYVRNASIDFQSFFLFFVYFPFLIFISVMENSCENFMWFLLDICKISIRYNNDNDNDDDDGGGSDDDDDTIVSILFMRSELS